MAVLTARGAQTRARIVDGAAALIRERGFAEVAIDDIRAATETSKSQIFHFLKGGKADLLLAVAEHEAEQVLADQQPALAELGPPESWRAWRDVVVDRYARQRDRCPLSALTSELGKSSPQARAVVSDLYDRWQTAIADGIRRLQADGGAPGLDPDDAAATALTAVQGGVLMLMATDRLHYLEGALDAAIERLLESADAPTPHVLSKSP
jgi:AcrR family transcriptional regulator